jgi:hypothetical protein
MAISLLDYANQTPDQIRRGLVQRITNESVMMTRLNFVQVAGYEYRYSRLESLGSVGFRALNANYVADVGTVIPQVERLSTFGGQVTTDQSILRQPNGRDIQAGYIAAKVRKAGLFFDRMCIDGDPAVDPNHFVGLNARLLGNQLITTATNGAQLTLAMLDDAIDRVVGTSGKIIVCNKAVARRIKQLLVASAGGAVVGDVGGQAMTYQGIPIVVVDEDGDEQAILGFDETVGSSNITASLYVIRAGSDTDGEYVQGLVNTDSIVVGDDERRGTQVFNVIEAGMGLAMFHPRSACRVRGILAPV